MKKLGKIKESKPINRRQLRESYSTEFSKELSDQERKRSNEGAEEGSCGCNKNDKNI